MGPEIDFVDLYEFLLKNEVEQPVTVLKHGRPCAALIPYDVFEALVENARKAIRAQDLSAEDVQTIRSAEMSDEHKKYDSEVEK